MKREKKEEKTEAAAKIAALNVGWTARAEEVE